MQKSTRFNSKFLNKHNLYVWLCGLNFLVWGARNYFGFTETFLVGGYLLATLLKEATFRIEYFSHNNKRWIYYNYVLQYSIIYAFVALVDWNLLVGHSLPPYSPNILAIFVVLILFYALFAGSNNPVTLIVMKIPYFTVAFLTVCVVLAGIKSMQNLIDDRMIWIFSLIPFFILYISSLKGRFRIGKSKSPREATANFVLLYYIVMLMIGLFKTAIDFL